jgi:F-type H+-transporting ATPase subunit epsilon
VSRAFSLRILSAERTLFSGEVESVILPALNGYLGVMAGHAPMVAALEAGEVAATTSQGERMHFAVSGGIANVTGDSTVVLANSAEKPEEIDVPRAEAARDRALQRLHIAAGEADLERARGALARARNRLKVALRAQRS